MKIFNLIWPFMIYNSLYMPTPVLLTLKERPYPNIKNTYKKTENYHKKIVQYNVRSRLKGR